MTKDVEMEDVRKLAAETSRSVFYDRLVKQVRSLLENEVDYAANILPLK